MPVRTSLMSDSMLPLVSRASPRCKGSTRPRSPDSGNPSAKYVIDCGLPSSMTSKSSAFNPVIGDPCLSVTTTLK